MRALVIDDDKDISSFLSSSLEAEAFAVDTADDGEKGSYLARTNDYDIVLLDLMLPKKDGGQICREIRASGKTMPIIMLSVASSSERKVDLLDYGADDYLTKPFSFQELMARIRAVLRRPKKIESDILQSGNLCLDSAKQRVTSRDQQVHLTRKEFSLLEYLMRNRGSVVSRGMILEHVWNEESNPFSNTIEAHILNLRRKLSLSKNHDVIHTIPGRGYMIDDTESPQPNGKKQKQAR